MPLKLPQIGGLGPRRQTPYDPSNPWDPDHLARDFARRDAEFKRVDDENLKKGRDIYLGPSPDPARTPPPRLILTSPNGNKWSITVDDTGVISGVVIP